MATLAESLDNGNLASIRLDPKSGAVATRWHNLDEADRAEIENLAAVYGVPVSIEVGAKWTAQSRIEAADKVTASDAWAERLGITLIAPTMNDEALTVFIEGETPDAQTRAELEAFAGVPVEFVPNPEPFTPETG